MIPDIFKDNDVIFTILMNYSRDGLCKYNPHVELPGKVVSWQQDNPYVVSDRVAGNYSSQHWLCADAAVIPHAKLYYGDFASIDHLPHWATDFGVSTTERDVVPHSKRPIDLLFVGSIDEDSLAQAKAALVNNPEPFRRFTQNLLQRIWENPEVSIVDEALHVQSDIGEDLLARDKEAVFKCFHIVDTIVRQERRVNLLKALKHARNLRIVVVSNAPGPFKRYLADNHTFLGGGDCLTGIKAMEASKIVLNDVPLYTKGVTERLFNAQLRGAAVLSQTNVFLRTEFQDNESILLYRPQDDLSYLPEKLQDLVSDPQLEGVADAGTEITKTKHMARNRVDSLLALHGA